MNTSPVDPRLYQKISYCPWPRKYRVLGSAWRSPPSSWCWKDNPPAICYRPQCSWEPQYYWPNFMMRWPHI